MIWAHLDFCTSHWEEMKVLAHDFEALSGALRRRVLRRFRAYSSLLSQILLELRPDRGRADLRGSTFALFGMLNWVHTWYRSGRDLPVDQLAEHFSDLFLRGFLSTEEEDAAGPPQQLEHADDSLPVPDQADPLPSVPG